MNCGLGGDFGVERQDMDYGLALRAGVFFNFPAFAIIFV